MHDDAFLQAIIENPEDDAPRLIYADWLDEHGQPERAEFIRVQCELARMPAGDPRAPELHARERKLLGGHEQEWAGWLRGLRHNGYDTRRRRWRLFLAVEGVLLLAAVALVIIHTKWTLLPFSILCSWLCFTLPICFLYLIGRPPVMTLSPLIPSAESRRFRRELEERQALSDNQFYARFYAAAGIPSDIPARVRRCLSEFDGLADRATPADFLPLLDDERDYADVLHRIEEEFGVMFTEADYPAVDGTLDNLIRLVHAKFAMPTSTGTAPPAG